MAEFVAGQSSQVGEIRILPTDFELNLKPYSLITAKDRALPPSAQLLYDLVLEESRNVASTTYSPLQALRHLSNA
jgi:hypothetical protein